jgi:hypothetical protein
METRAGFFVEDAKVARRFPSASIKRKLLSLLSIVSFAARNLYAWDILLPVGSSVIIPVALSRPRSELGIYVRSLEDKTWYPVI